MRSAGDVNIVRAPEEIPEHADLFLAGGISGCPDWQKDAEKRLAPVPGVLINPRRHGRLSPEFEAEQVTWEYTALRVSGAILFWFPKETLCPIFLVDTLKVLPIALILELRSCLRYARRYGRKVNQSSASCWSDGSNRRHPKGKSARSKNSSSPSNWTEVPSAATTV